MNPIRSPSGPSRSLSSARFSQLVDPLVEARDHRLILLDRLPRLSEHRLHLDVQRLPVGLVARTIYAARAVRTKP
jgi:hypothetical protein